MQRFDWPLSQPIDLADIGNIPLLLQFGTTVASAMDWKSILSA